MSSFFCYHITMAFHHTEENISFSNLTRNDSNSNKQTNKLTHTPNETNTEIADQLYPTIITAKYIGVKTWIHR